VPLSRDIRSASPLMNGLELSANFLNGGLLRPVYADSNKALPDGTPLTTNMFTSPVLTNNRQVQAGFCFTCHNPHVERMGDNPNTREVPELNGVLNDFRPDQIRPLRDYYLNDAHGNQVLPAQPGGPAPDGVQPSLGASGITCDVRHNVGGADLNRSFQHDGFANTSLLLNQSMEKVGPFPFPVEPKGGFHVASADADKIAFLRSSALCNSTSAMADYRKSIDLNNLQNGTCQLISSTSTGFGQKTNPPPCMFTVRLRLANLLEDSDPATSIGLFLEVLKIDPLRLGVNAMIGETYVKIARQATDGDARATAYNQAVQAYRVELALSPVTPLTKSLTGDEANNAHVHWALAEIYRTLHQSTDQARELDLYLKATRQHSDTYPWRVQLAQKRLQQLLRRGRKGAVGLPSSGNQCRTGLLGGRRFRSGRWKLLIEPALNDALLRRRDNPVPAHVAGVGIKFSHPVGARC
jgi:hypothetical protein